jgi:competence protein ComEC
MYLVGNSIVLTKTEKIKNLLYFKDTKILIVDSTGILPSKAAPDVLILTQSPKINLDRVLKNIRPKLIIADGSNSNTIQKSWKNSCLKKNIPFHPTNEKGYYKL